MKKIILILLVTIISGCVAGEFTESRNKLHDQHYDICETEPSRCINGVPW